MATAGLFKLVVRILKINNLSQFFALVNIYYVQTKGIQQKSKVKSELKEDCCNSWSIHNIANF